MTASEKAVAAVLTAIDDHGVFVTERDVKRGVTTVLCRCGVGRMSIARHRKHVAVAAAVAAVDADRPSIQAQALREATEDVDVFLGQGYTGADDARATTMAAKWLDDRANQIEAQP